MDAAKRANNVSLSGISLVALGGGEVDFKSAFYFGL